MSLEINYSGFEYGWVQYEIYFRWQGESILNDSILKRNGEYWGSRPSDSLLANEHRECCILPLLQKVIVSNDADYCEPVEPDITLAIYPVHTFPFLPSHWKLVYEKENHKKEREEREQLKQEKGVLPDDLIDMMLLVDTYNFKGCSAYSGDGICLKMTVRRIQLEEFYENLKSEYITFKNKFNVDELNKEDYGDGWKPLEL